MAALTALLHWLSIPEVGLTAIFVIAFVSATLLPMGSEPAVFGLVKLQPELFWPAVLVATLGNTLGGALTWWIGFEARRVSGRIKPSDHRAMTWLSRYGAPACLLSWLPIVGDPLCAVAGWLRLPFWPCLFYMGLGKLGRYVTMTIILLSIT
ncbi:MAG: YqaA family protein [Aquabacterium sp.]|nr:YqaA family protein [Aquabacterium sp.]